MSEISARDAGNPSAPVCERTARLFLAGCSAAHAVVLVGWLLIVTWFVALIDAMHQFEDDLRADRIPGLIDPDQLGARHFLFNPLTACGMVIVVGALVLARTERGTLRRMFGGLVIAGQLALAVFFLFIGALSVSDGGFGIGFTLLSAVSAASAGLLVFANVRFGVPLLSSGRGGEWLRRRSARTLWMSRLFGVSLLFVSVATAAIFVVGTSVAWIAGDDVWSCPDTQCVLDAQ